MATQYESVLAMLRSGWTCGTTLLKHVTPRYSARIHEIRERSGLRVDRRTCQSHAHGSKQWEWRAVERPDLDSPIPGEKLFDIQAQMRSLRDD